MPPLPVAFSCCPNDTFLFHAWVHQFVGQDQPLLSTLSDIETLNEWAKSALFPLIKVSIINLPMLLDRYVFLPVGSAIGCDCGPKIIAKQGFELKELPNKSIAIPGASTTAHALLNRLLPPPKIKHFCTYDKVFEWVNSGQVDCGLIIHESRFTFREAGFCEICDLGNLWQQRYELPLALGGVAVLRSLDNIKSIITNLQDSLLYAWSHPKQSYEYILKHSQEKQEKVIADHIALYVNQETLQLSTRGSSAIETLIGLEKKRWLYS